MNFLSLLTHYFKHIFIFLYLYFKNVINYFYLRLNLILAIIFRQ